MSQEEDIEATAELHYLGGRENAVPWADLPEACREIWRAVARRGATRADGDGS